MNFFIFSLPRSGSAWLSVFLTGADSYCYHELTIEQDWPLVAGSRKEQLIGAVDTAAILDPKKIYDLYPHIDYYSLVRNKEDINKSLRRVGLGKFNANKYPLPPHTPIFYEKLHDIGYLNHIWDAIIGTPFDKERAERLVDMNIQRDLVALFSKMNSIANTARGDA
jgi:hypothetical protein